MNVYIIINYTCSNMTYIYIYNLNAIYIYIYIYIYTHYNAFTLIENTRKWKNSLHSSSAVQCSHFIQEFYLQLHKCRHINNNCCYYEQHNTRPLCYNRPQVQL